MQSDSGLLAWYKPCGDGFNCIIAVVVTRKWG